MRESISYVSLGASVGAFVASTNVTCTRFYSRVIYNRTAQELMDGLQQCMRGEHRSLDTSHRTAIVVDSLKEYHRVNNALPEKSRRPAFMSFVDGCIFALFPQLFSIVMVSPMVNWRLWPSMSCRRFSTRSRRSCRAISESLFVDRREGDRLRTRLDLNSL